MILCLRSDSADAELYLLINDKPLTKLVWNADRQLAKQLLRKIDTLLSDTGVSWSQITGLVVYRGPGSFTGLRIGCTVMNTLAYAHNLPIVGTSNETWIQEGQTLLSDGKNHVSVMPEYGAEPRITAPRK